MLRTFITAAIIVALAACGSVARDGAPAANGASLKDTIGKPYSQVVRQRPDIGNLIEYETLDSGDQIMKHVGLGTAPSQSTGIYGKQEQQARIVYFLVDSKGVVKDWAAESYKAVSADCWVGICGPQKVQAIPAEELDRLVKTSSGTTLATWRTGHGAH